MKITDLAILFVIIVLPFNLINYLKIGDVKSSSFRTIEINRILDTAIQDGTAKLVEVGANNRVIINKERAVQAFFNSLYVNFDVLDNSVLQRKISGYVPVIVIVDYDGYYVISQETYKNSDSYSEIKHVWKPKKMFSYSDDIYVYTFTLDDHITVYNTLTKAFYKGDYHDLKGKFASNVINDDTFFQQIRRKTIIENIKGDVNYCINKHNDIALKYGITYHFSVPSISNEDWYRTINDVGMLAFFQGLPISTSGERFNSFALGGARIVKGPKYYVEVNATTGVKHYHRESCTILTTMDTVLNSRQECAKNGYFPCIVCNP